MKNTIKYMALVALGLVACEPEFDNSVEENEGFYTNGEADFSNYVALGNSLTAGFADNALYIRGQENSYPNILAQQFSHVGGGEFTQPLMNDNLGGLLLGGNQIQDTRLILELGAGGSPAPDNIPGDPTTEITNTLSGPFNNMGVPGAKSFHLVAPGYGNVANLPSANPYFVRFRSSENATVLEDALAQNPTFFSLWIGNNDVLSYAVSGGTGVNQIGNLDPSTYGSNDITDPNVFAQVFSSQVSALMQSASGGVVLNIPNVTDTAFFNTVPNDALVLDASQATSLTAYFSAVSQVFAGVLMSQGVPQEQAVALASQYAITFNEGPNRFIIDVPVTQANPLGFRQMTEDELIQLQVDQEALQNGYGSVVITPMVEQVLAILMQGGTPSPEEVNILFSAVSGLDDGDVLDSAEITEIETATAAFNATIENVAQAHGLAYVDANALLNQVADGGIVFDGGMVTSEFATGGAFSLDGIHLTPRGYAIVANRIIEAVNSTYNSTVPMVNVGDYNGGPAIGSGAQ